LAAAANHTRIIALLFAHGCTRLNRRDPQSRGDTPLHAAIRRSAVEAMTLLCYVCFCGAVFILVHATALYTPTHISVTHSVHSHRQMLTTANCYSAPYSQLLRVCVVLIEILFINK
jgi:hypothetical protein